MSPVFFPSENPTALFAHSQKVKVSIRGAGVWKKAAQCQVLVCLRKNDELGRSNFQVRELSEREGGAHGVTEGSEPVRALYIYRRRHATVKVQHHVQGVL